MAEEDSKWGSRENQLKKEIVDVPIIQQNSSAINMISGLIKYWKEKKITEEIYSGYFQYHQERMENVFDNKDCLLSGGRQLTYQPAES